MPRFFLPVTVVRVWVMELSLDGLPSGSPIVAQVAHFIQLPLSREPELRQKKQTIIRLNRSSRRLLPFRFLVPTDKSCPRTFQIAPHRGEKSSTPETQARAPRGVRC